MPDCRYCHKSFHRLGIMRHEAAHRDEAKEDQSWRCEATVLVRDTYRRTGRGKTGFEMHYTERQCKFNKTSGKYCWKHQDHER